MKRGLLTGAAFVTILVALGVAQASSSRRRSRRAQGAAQAPRFEVDPFWPKPLPNHWVLGNAIGVWVDEHDHVWIVHRSSATLANNEKALELKAGDCCAGAPPVLAFDRQGNLVQQLGRTGPGLRLAGVEPRHLHRSHRQRLDRRQRPGRLAHPEVHAGRQVRGAVRQAERAPDRQERARADPRSRRAAAIQSNFGRVAKIFVDPKANEAYIADGYFNRRVAVLDAATGKMKRFWGAYGKTPDDTVPLGPYDPAAPPFPAVPQPGALRRPVERRPRLRLRPRQRPHPGVQAGRHVRQGSRSSRRTPRRRARCGTSRSRRIRSSGSSTSPTA